MGTDPGRGTAVAIAVAVIGTVGVIIAASINSCGTKVRDTSQDRSVVYSGRVVAPDNIAVRNAEVSLESIGAPVVVSTDSEGVYEISLTETAPEASRRLRVRAAGFADFDRFLPITSSKRFEDIHLSLLPGATAGNATPGPITSPVATPPARFGLPSTVRIKDSNRASPAPSPTNPSSADNRIDRHCDLSTVKIISNTDRDPSQCTSSALAEVIPRSLPGDEHTWSFAGHALVCSCKAK